MSAGRIVVMGVSGCGKSTLGEALAQRLGVAFLEGDSLHPAENIRAMAAGVALDDAMRLPWLQSIADRLHSPSPGIIASCSALRRRYRDVLRASGPVFFVHLAIDLPAARARMQARPGHFMNPALADSQNAILEPLGPDEWGMTVDASQPADQLLHRICHALRR